jgi:hypothetical protein
MMKIIANISTPFVAVFIGIVLSLALVARVPPQQLPSEYLMDHYGRSLWITLFVSSYLTGAGILLKEATLSVEWKRALIGVPSGAFILCLLCVGVLPKFGLDGNAITVWIPTVLSALSLGIAGYKLGV